jgi:DinB superfamily
MAETDLRYPIGKFAKPASVPGDERRKHVDVIAEMPSRFAAAVAGLTAGQLDTAYRPGGWTVRQLIHHLPDSHMNAYVRFKLALTEDEPTIKTYEEARWAELADSQATPVETSLALLENLHARWVPLLRSLSEAEWERKFRHPELGPMRLDQNLALYSWHGRHHTAHVTSLRQRNGWR